MLSELLDAVAATAPIRTLRGSVVLYPLANAFHIASFGAMLGAIATDDIAILRREASIPLARRIAAWGCGLAIVSGFVLFLCRGANYIANPAFLAKLGLLVLALLNVAAAHRAATAQARRITALLSLTLWISVLIAGRYIGFL